MRLSLYNVDPAYITYLRQFDLNVPIFEKTGANRSRPLIGVVVIIEGCKFYAPLTSPKPKHLTMNNSISFVKIEEGVLGAINLNNMIPVSDLCITEVDVANFPILSKADQEYKALLEKQLTWCNVIAHKEVITNRAEALYKLISSNKANQTLAGLCCKFMALVQKCQDYK